MATTRVCSVLNRLFVALLVLTPVACSSSHGKSGSSASPPCTDCTPTGDLTFTLPSPAGATLWTTTTMDKVVREAAPPTTAGSAIAMHAAKNEFEPFQIVVRADNATTATLSMTPFSGPGTISGIEIRRVGYVNIQTPSDSSSIKSPAIPDPLYPTTFGATESLAGGQDQPFWITVTVPADATAGDYTSTLTVNVNGASQNIPVNLHVFNFALPAKIGFDGNWNVDFNALGGGASLDVVKQLKDFFYQHRLTPSSVAWPAGLNYNGGITYDCASGTFQTSLTDPYDFSQLGPEYIDGTGWNNAGFPSFEIMQFVDNSTPRPQTFCGVDIGSDQYGTTAYNAAWSTLLAAIDAYLVANNWQDKGYYYVQNEPQNQTDYDLAAYLAGLTKAAAPHTRIAVSKQPLAAIAENPKANGASYDLWWADLSLFDPVYADTRQGLGETVWWYFLFGDLPPYFNPITIDHSGIESRIPFWGAWKYRIKGFAYYSLTGWGSDPINNPTPQGTNQNGDGFLLYPPTSDGQLVTSIRFELLREGAEDFEYLLLAGGGTMPATPETASTCDSTVQSAVSSPTSYTHDTSALQHLRDQLGAMIAGEVTGCPVLQSTLPGAHAKGSYYINFQDPNGEPTDNPLVVNGHTWTKIGWDAYDATKGFGWYGPYIGNSTIMLYQYLADSSVDELQKSIIYDDYGRVDTFEWDIENGSYNVTVSIGWDGKTYSNNMVVVEGQTLFDNVETNPTTPYQVKTITVNVTDGNISMEVGQFNQYTMLNWMSIEPAN